MSISVTNLADFLPNAADRFFVFVFFGGGGGELRVVCKHTNMGLGKKT